MIDVQIIPVLQDNYAYVLLGSNGEIGIVDPGEAKPVIDYLDAHHYKPTIIFNTHHHGDHIAGDAEISARYSCPIAGPQHEARIPNVEIPLAEGVDVAFGGDTLHVLATPGHTAHHICLYFTQSRILFSGDALFSMGCGRLFEGTAEEMWLSLQKLNELPSDTQIYCGHEYTESNGKFCQHIEPANTDISERMKEVQKLRMAGQPTLPVTLETEFKTNVFLRAQTAQEFGKLRSLKDNF